MTNSHFVSASDRIIYSTCNKRKKIISISSRIDRSRQRRESWKTWKIDLKKYHRIHRVKLHHSLCSMEDSWLGDAPISRAASAVAGGRPCIMQR